MTRTSSARPGPMIGIALSLSLALAAAGCGSDDASPRSGNASTTDVGADLLGSRVEAGAGMQPRVPVTSRPQTAGQAPTLDELGFTEGDPAAGVRIIEFSDFGCGYCRRFHDETFPTLREEYIAAGLVEWKFVPMILGIFGPNSEAAALTGECVGAQGPFARIREELFATQSEWKSADDPMPHFASLAREAGVDMAEWGQCMRSRDAAERVAFGTALSREAGVRGTPTFFIVGYQAIPGAIPLDLFRQVLDTVIADQSATMPNP